ncbi:LpqN/LpqT family lipoprotein [Rhodococcus sp. IEGM1428]|uniref:LpqN/LpqT family lipoprotein n=1 Tax=Rhodococcus sp. IEGM1428 TaxID=3392191 RepID=UPI003D11C713
MNDAQSPEPTEPTTIAEYLNAHAIRVSPLDGAAAAELGITVPVPAGWQTLDPAQFPGATQVIVEPNLVENGFAPNAVLLVGALSHTIDPESLMALGFGDGRAMPGWVEREASTASWLGWPSRFIRGSYVAQQLEAAVTTRYVLLGVDTQYLVQLTVTTLASQLDALAFDVTAINDGLTTNGS